MSAVCMICPTRVMSAVCTICPTRVVSAVCRVCPTRIVSAVCRICPTSIAFLFPSFSCKMERAGSGLNGCCPFPAENGNCWSGRPSCLSGPPAAQAGGKKRLQASEGEGWVGGGEILSKIQDDSKCPAGCKM